MRVLIACEFSGVVRDAFIRAGDDAVSCDIVPSDRPGPHHIGNVLAILRSGFDMMVAFPPCRYLTRAGSRFWPDPAWRAGQHRAGRFIQALWAAPIPRICIENPPGAVPRYIGRFHQTIQPWHFGHPYTKLTCLWLKGLPPLIDSGQSCGRRSWTEANNAKSKQRSRRRSRTFEGVARAMAAQWSGFPTPDATA